MPSRPRRIRESLGLLAARADALHARGRSAWYRYVPRDREWTIVPYIGFGTRGELQASGRVLRRKFHRPADASQRGIVNLVEFWKRMDTDELPGARVRVRFRDRLTEVAGDDEGHFGARIALAQPVASGWHAVDFELVGAPTRRPGRVHATADVLVPAESARFGVISDIDDTVVVSNVQRRIAMLAALVRSNARTRKPFKGVGAFYRALNRGASGGEANPLFYVSQSPWNLYGPLVDFLDFNGLPRGPLLLDDFGEHMLFAGGDRRPHKRAAIDRILDTYPALPFVLVGDSGERDPEIYADVVRARPGRVRAIYIRSIDRGAARLAAIDALFETVRAAGVELVLAPDSEHAAVHAAGEGLIAVDALDDIRADKRADAVAPPAGVPS